MIASVYTGADQGQSHSLCKSKGIPLAALIHSAAAYCKNAVSKPD